MKLIFTKLLLLKGASKRLEKIAETPTVVAYKDFALTASKVKATTGETLKKQYPNQTYSLV